MNWRPKEGWEEIATKYYLGAELNNPRVAFEAGADAMLMALRMTLKSAYLFSYVHPPLMRTLEEILGLPTDDD